MKNVGMVLKVTKSEEKWLHLMLLAFEYNIRDIMIKLVASLP